MSEEPDKVITVARATLYQEVWSIPGRTLAKKYGVSDVALGKACKRHNIPRPPPGHWAKLAHGKASPQIPLPPQGNPRLNEIRFYGDASGARSFHDPDLEFLTEAPGHAVMTTVPEKLTTPHPFIVATREYLKALKSDQVTPGHRRRAPYVNVSSSGLDRAFRILDALTKAWESIGGAVTEGRGKNDATKDAAYFAIGEDRLPVVLEERQERLPGKRGWDVEWRYTGQLVLRIDCYWNENLRATWADGKRQRLEEILDSVITGFLRRISHEKHQRLDREIEERQNDRVVQRRTAAERRKAEEKRRREQLKTDVDSWHEAERIRHYLSVLDAEIGAGNWKPHNEDAFRSWMKWAFWYADHIDPLIQAEPSAEENKQPANTPVEQLEWTSHTRPIVERLGVRDTDALYRLRDVQITAEEGRGRSGALDEVRRVLEGLGYDISRRRP